MLNQKTWKPSVVVGSILIAMGIVPFVLWVLDYIDVVRPEEDPAHWGIIVISAALFGFGTLLVQGKGDSISEVLLNALPMNLIKKK